MIPSKSGRSGRSFVDLNSTDSLTGAAWIRARSRRSALRQIGLAGFSLLAAPALASDPVKLPLPSDPRERPMTHGFPQKGSMILQRTRPPLLETPMEVFDRGVFTPNDQFIGCLSAGLLISTPALVQQSPAIKSTTVDLPSGDSLFPGGAAADAINNNCLACHSADMVLNQPALPKATWEAEVHKMINVYKAPIDEADVPAIVDYLASTKGAK
jgi:mono/diheme cytochrome c family protein